MQKLTKRVVDSAKPPETGEARLWDSELAGFCLRLYASNRKVYALKYRVSGRQRWLTIGEHGSPWTPDQARSAAAEALLEARRGVDPAAAKRARDDLTMTKLIGLYLNDGPRSKPGKRELSWRQDRSNLLRHVKPILGRRLVSGLAKGDFARMVSAITAGETATVEKTKARGKAIVRGGEGTAARCYSTTRAMLAWAIEEGLTPGPNPCSGLKLAARPSVERFLSEKQATDLLLAIRALHGEGAVSASHSAIFQLLLFTGARRTEISGLRWSEVDFAGERLVLPPDRTKTGRNSGERRITLNSVSLTLLRSLEREKGDGPFVFPAGRGASGFTTGEGKVWRSVVLPRAGLTGVRLHDLRHSFASFALADGASLALIGKALGHASSRTTERYAKLSDDPLRAMSERLSDRFKLAAVAG